MKLTVKIFFLITIAQLTSASLAVNTHSDNRRIMITESSNKNFLLGDGKNTDNPKKKQGESLRGYFYRVYSGHPVFAKNVKFKGPFKHGKIKKFLKQCQERDGKIQESTHLKNKRQFFIHVPMGREQLFNKIYNITLSTKVDCLVHGTPAFSQKWLSIYLDRDEVKKTNQDIEIPYKSCSLPSQRLKVDESSVHYDENLKCHAEVTAARYKEVE